MGEPQGTGGRKSPRSRPPAGLDALRARLDAAAVRRALLPHEHPVLTPQQRVEALGVPAADVVQALLAEAEGDYVVAIIPGFERLDLPALATAVGARRARLIGAEGLQRRLGYRPGALPLVTGLPTVVERALLGRAFLFGPSGDPLWTLRLEPEALRRATAAIAAPIVRPPASRPG